MSKSQVKMMLLIGLGVLALLPGARADQWNQKTVVTFHAPIEIPGQILPAGTYVFKLADSHSSRHIVQIFNKDENHLFSTILAIPDYRRRPSEKTIIRFEERAAGAPQAIKAWFYPGRNYGHEFVYPKTEAVALAKANNTPVLTTPAELPPIPQVTALIMVPLMLERPSGEEVELSEASAPREELPETLPKTASPLPLMGLIGLLSLGTAAVMRFAAR